MANTRFQLKRSTISGIKPTTSDIATAELGINVADRKLFSSNGTAIFEVGSNLTSIAIGNTTAIQTINSTGVYINGVVNVSGNVAIGGITTLAANVILGSSGLSANGGFGTAGQLLNSNGTATYWAADRSANAYTNAVAYVDGKSYVNTAQLSSNLANYQTTAGLSANVAVLTSNSANFLGNSSGTIANVSSWVTGNAATSYTNAVSYVDGKSYVNTSQLSSNLANYQTSAGLSANVATLTSNNSSFAYGKTEINLNVNNALTANSSTFLGTANLQNIQTYISSNAGAAYSNAVAYVDGKAYVNTAQLSSNLANYQTTAGLSANVATLAANSSTYANASITNAFTVGTSTYFVSNGNVGIGNTAPNAKLAITGTANISGDVAIGGNVSISGVIKGQAAALSGDVLFIGDNTKLVDINVLDTVGLYSQSNTLIGSLKLGSNGGIISGFNGKIGIGNLAPDATLSITGTANVSGNVVIGGSLITTNVVTVGTSTYFVSNGNVGIGNTTPDAKLTVTGTANISGDVVIGGITTHNANVILGSSGLSANGGFGTAGQLLNSNGTATYWAADRSANAYTNAVAYVDGKAYVNTSQLSSNLANYQTTAGLASNVATLTANNTSFVGTISAANVVSNAQLSSNLANYQTSAGLSANMAVRAANSSTYANASISNTFTVGTSTYFVSNGNVGVGTNSPGYKVSINGGALGSTLGSTANAFQIYSTTSNIDYINFSKVREAVGSDWTTAAWRMQQVVDVTPMAYIQFNGNGLTAGLSFGTGGSGVSLAERMRIDASGNVGIGNTAPNAKLAITGTANVSGNVVIGGITTHNANVILGSSGLSANGGFGTAGQVLTSNATAVYWSTPTTGTVTSVATGNGLTGGPITSTGTVSVLANNGITANSTGTFVTQGTGTVVNATGVHVNSTYIGTLSANNTTYLNGQLAAYYTNATNITTGTLPWAQAPTNSVNTTAAFTFSALHTFNGNSSALSTVLVNAGETTTISAIAANGTINYDLTTQSVLYYTTNAAANWTVNFRGSSGTTLNNALANSQTITAAFLVSQGAAAYFANNTQIDGANVTPKWQGGTAPTAGNASGVDVYTYTIVKTANATFTVFASQTKFA